MSTDASSNRTVDLLSWSVRDVLEWLYSLNLSYDYSQLFKEYKIDGQALFKITPQYIDQYLQITNPADRSILVQSINNLRMSQISNHLPHLNSTQPPLSSNGHHKTKRHHHKSKSVGEMDAPSIGEEKTHLSHLSNVPKSLTPTPHFSSPHLLEILKDENTSLKRELEYYYQRVCKLQKLEHDLESLSEAHKLLESTTARKEKLELAMRQKLEGELRKYKEADVQREVNLHSIRRNASFKAVKPEVTVKRELARRDSIIAKLIQQNHDVTAVRERLEKDLNTMKSALTANERKTERDEEKEIKEVEKNDESQAALNYSNSINKLQSILSSMLTSSQKQSNLEGQLRKQLEEKIEHLENGEEREKENDDIRIITLEADKAKLEHKCLELIAERQLSHDVITIPRDAYISQLERQLKEKENELNKTKEQKIFYMKSLETAQETIINLNTRIPSLEATLKERDTLIETLKSLLDPDEAMPINATPNSADITRKTSLTSNGTKLSIRKISSPVVTSIPNKEVVVLPTYDQHIMKQSCHLAPPIINNKVRSFPNTPEVQRRDNYRGYPSPALSAPNSHHGSPLPIHKPRPVHKSLTPPPYQLPLQVTHKYDSKSLDSDDSLELLSPSSPFSSCGKHFIKKNNTSLAVENQSQDSGVLMDGTHYISSHF